MNPSDNGYFIVTSHGWSASNWLAYSLNLNRYITCAHSSAAIIANDPNVFAQGGLRKRIPELRRGYQQRQNRSLRDIYADIQTKQPSPFVGTVHTFRLRDLPIQQNRFSFDDVSYKTVNLVRHPLDLVVSGYGQFKELFLIDIHEFSWTLNKIIREGHDIVSKVCEKHRFNPGDFDKLCFFGACVVLGSLRDDLDALSKIEQENNSPWNFVKTVKMEEITQEPKCLEELIESLTGCTGLVSKNYLCEVFDQGKINIHNQDAPSGVPNRWRQLEDWQRDAFKLFLQKYSLQDAYEAYGYCFEFLTE